MGIISGIVRFFAGKRDDDEYDPYRGSYHQFPGSWDSSSSSSSSQTSLNILSLFSFIYRRALNPLWTKLVGLLLCFPRPGRTKDPILPTQNAPPPICNDPSLPKTNFLVSSSPSANESSAAFHRTPVSAEPCFRTSVRENAVYAPPRKEIFTPRKQPEPAIISKAEFRYSLFPTAVCQEERKKSAADENLQRWLAARLKNVKPQVVAAEEVPTIKRTVTVDKGRWIKHYSSRHQILVVGDGDFSFSVSLAVAFGCASNMTATSLNSKGFLMKNYRNAQSNLRILGSMKCEVIHKIDATNMAGHKLLRLHNFDRIIYNFPYAGIIQNLPRQTQLRQHRELVNLFMMNAKKMIRENGEIHITHKTNGFHAEWNLEGIASEHNLKLIEAVEFKLDDYPGYKTKYGFGGDSNFDCHPSKTYKFGLKRCVIN